MKILSEIKENIYGIVLILTLFIGVFFLKLIPYCFLILILFWLIKYSDFSNVKAKLIWILPFLFYLVIILVSFFFADSYIISIKILERHSPFLILPLVIFYKKWTQKELLFVGYFFVFITTAIAVFSIFKLIYFYYTHIDFVKSMDDTYLQWKLPHLTGFHPTYFGFIIVVANIMILSGKLNQKISFKNYLLYISIFLSFYLLYISPRNSAFCLLLVWVCFAFRKLKTLNQTHFFILVIIGLVSLTVFLLSSQYLTNKFVNSITDKRFILWLEAFKIIKDNYFILGEGLGNSNTILENYISSNKLSDFKVPDLHNQYLMNYVDIGVFGVIAIFVMTFIPYKILKDKTLLLFLIVFSISMITESFLYVIKGIVIFIILNSYFILNSKKYNELTDNINL